MDFHGSMIELGYIPTMKRKEFIQENGLFSAFIQKHLNTTEFETKFKSDVEYMSKFFQRMMAYCHAHECTHMQMYLIFYLLFYIQKCIVQHARESTAHNARLRHEYVCLLVSMSRYIQLRERGVPIKKHARAIIVRVVHQNYVPISKSCEYDYIFWLFRLIFHMFVRECNVDDEPAMCDVSYLLTILYTLLDTESSHIETKFIYHILSSSTAFIRSCEKLCAKLHSNIHWITLVELMTSIISTIIYSPLSNFSVVNDSVQNTSIRLDGRWIRFLLLLMNDSNNTNMMIDMYPKLLHLMVDILDYQMIDIHSDPYIRQIFNFHNVHAFIRVIDLYSPGSSRYQTMCIYIFDLVNYLFDKCPSNVHASHVLQLMNRMTPRFHTPNLTLFFEFVIHVIHHFPDVILPQHSELCDRYIRRYMEYVEQQENDESNHGSNLGRELTTFLISYTPKFITPELFEHLCLNYTCFMSFNAIQFCFIIRMIMQSAFSRQDWRYAAILKVHPDIFSEIDNPNQPSIVVDDLRYIKYTLTHTSLKDKCKLHVVENIEYYIQHVDINDFLFVYDD